MLKKWFHTLPVLILLVACEGDEYVTYEWTELDLAHLKNEDLFPEVATFDSVPKEAYGLRLYLYPVEVNREGRYFDEYESQVTNTNTVDSILVSANADFITQTDTLFAGEAINELFYVFNHNYKLIHQLTTTSLHGTAYYYDDYAEKNFPEFVDLLLMNPPVNNTNCAITVWIRLADGTVFTDTTSPILLY